LRSRLERIDSINRALDRSGTLDASTVNALGSEPVTRLHRQFVDASRAASESAAQNGENDPRSLQLRIQARETQRDLQMELRTVESTARSNYEVAKSREDQLRENVQRLTQMASGQRQAKLRELESSANNYRAIYDNFLQRYTQTIQQESFPLVEARVVARAGPPSEKYSPKTLLILAISLVAGSVFGTGAALGREFLDRSVRTSEQLAATTGVQCLGILPEIELTDLTGANKPAAPDNDDLPASARMFLPPDIMSIVQIAPFSRFAETIRSIKLSLDVGNYRCRVIGVSSCLPGEGKTTIAANLAQLMAMGGSRVLLIDADLRNPMLTHALAPKAERGLADVVKDPKSLADTVWRHPTRPGLHFLPARASSQSSDSFVLLTGERTRQLLAEHTGEYHYVILDLPPLIPVVDTRAASSLIDGLVLVTRWGATSVAVIKKSLETSGRLTDKLVGAVLNRVDVNQLKNYEGLDDNYYESKYYMQYEHVKERVS
jgi:polysaccharide biosynthesis transport protein